MKIPDDPSIIRKHIIERINDTKVYSIPYPHMVIDNLFPDDFAKKINTLFPVNGDVSFIHNTCDEKPQRYTRSFFRPNTEKSSLEGVMNDIFDKELLETFLQKYNIANKHYGWGADYVWDYNNKGKNALLPHCDHPCKILSMVYYVPVINEGQDDVQRMPGTDILMQNDNGEFQEFRSVQAKFNRCTSFVRSNYSWHAVKETRVPRRTITFFIIRESCELFEYKKTLRG
jgi:hypothetical protein